MSRNAAKPRPVRCSAHRSSSASEAGQILMQGP
jgi:hypothetical protein